MKRENFIRATTALTIGASGLLASLDHRVDTQMSGFKVPSILSHQEYDPGLDYKQVDDSGREPENNIIILNIQPISITVPSIRVFSANIEESVFDEKKGDLTVPNFGFATPPGSVSGLINTSWVYAHSSWKKEKGTFQDLNLVNIGDEIFLDGRMRITGQEVLGLRYVVERIYLTDRDSGSKLVRNDEGEIPKKPILYLQTSVREAYADDPDKWVFEDKDLILGKAENIVEGDLDDPSKYLLLFVEAHLAE